MNLDDSSRSSSTTNRPPRSSPPRGGSSSSTYSSSISTNPRTGNMTLLPPGFQPGEYDVICGRGKKCYNHIGNAHFRKRVMGMLDEYSKAKSKLDKSGVLATVVDQIRAASPNGGFVKQNDSGRWYEVGDFLAREKTSQAFRDALHERYKSSNVAKKKRRQEEQARASDKFRLSRSHSDTSTLEWLALSQEMGGLNMRSEHSRSGGSNNANYDIFHGTQFDVVARMNRLASSEQRSGGTRFGRGTGNMRSHSGPLTGMSVGMPDPLFGTPDPAGAAFMTQRQILSGAPSRSSRSSSSVPTSPKAEPDRYPTSFNSELDSSFDLGAARLPPQGIAEERHRQPLTMAQEEELMHRSMPNLATSGFDPLSNSGSMHHNSAMAAMHNSTPNIHFAPESSDRDDSFGGDFDPIPLDDVITPRPGARKSVGDSFRQKPLSMTLSPTSPSVEVVSKDLLACLEKLTGSSIKDNNPFEPLPLRPEDDHEDLEEVRSDDEDDKKPPATLSLM